MTQTSAARVTSVDALRGAIMVIMALDHVRDFLHAGAMTFSPEDLARTTPLLFFTRWITHVCAPGFMFLAGVGAFLRLERDGSRARLSRFLWTRGLWLILIELTVMRLAMNFTLAPQYPVLLLILWAIGLSMIALAALIHLPPPALAAASIALIGLHNLLDGVQPAQFGDWAPLWQILHAPGFFVLGGMPFVVGYPILPWIGVMAAGFWFGRVFRLEPGRRRRILVTTGLVLVGSFLVLRTINGYGDPVPWSQQDSLALTVASFLRCTKYPPSLDFLLMTLGPALVALAYFERRQPGDRHPLVVIGRVPFFYYVTHFWLIHILSAVLAYLRYGGTSIAFLFMPAPSMGGPRDIFPSDFGYPLWVTYVAWIGVVAALYPLCRWLASLKRRHRGWWVGYV